MTSQKICGSLFGELTENEKGSRVCYQATFIADNSNIDEYKRNNIT